MPTTHLPSAQRTMGADRRAVATARRPHLAIPIELRRRCFKGVDPRLESDSKLVPIDQEAKHQIVHRCRCGKANGAPAEPLDPGPQGDVFAFDCLRVLLAYVMAQ